MNKPFVVDATTVKAVREFLDEATVRSYSTSFAVLAEDFPTWCAALEVESFFAQTTKSGDHLVSTHKTLTDRTEPKTSPYGCALVYVRSSAPPARWVTFPKEHGTRRFLFHFKES